MNKERGLGRKLILCLAAMTTVGMVFVRLSGGAEYFEKEMALMSDSSSSDSSSNEEVKLSVSNTYERRNGRTVGNGLYPFDYLVDVAAVTRHELSNGEARFWSVFRIYKDGTRNLVASSQVATTSFEIDCYTEPGKYIVEASNSDDNTLSKYQVTAKRVRRELRDLEEDALLRYFAALQIVYSVPDEAGQKLYGEKYVSASWLVREHLYGAANRECDHYHDDAGFVNHHVAITWQMEDALASVDTKVAAHYWDYTYDALELGTDWYDSIIFADDWFGTANPNNTEHILDKGRFAYTQVMTNARTYSNVTNPYGLLRSPWNTNKNPFVMRFSYVLGASAGGYSTFPECDEFALALMTNSWIGETYNQLNGGFHGPVHIMIGGYWGWDPKKWNKITEKSRISAVGLLLFAKFLWRQGYSRCPDTCSSDTPQDECYCECPDTIRGNKTAYQILNESGAVEMDVFPSDGKGFTYESLLDGLCRIGFPGEMFTSAAPQDPTFWPLHGLAERFIQYARILKERGIIDFSEKWGYEHSKDLPSDTGIVCDWSQVSGLEMPHCYKETCPGHKEDDVLPFANLVEDGPTLFTNAEFYQVIKPGNDAMPYVYDSLTYWPACGGDIFEYAKTKAQMPQVTGGSSFQ
mmetsp:Transcript_19502/g.25262  ORF Transcript_19502/g.25262 Transcript_19502/m.25262 type:complete len:635 (+) Transcript_19502:47-1951(+)